MERTSKENRKTIRIGSIALSINAGTLLNMLLCFAAIDLAFLLRDHFDVLKGVFTNDILWGDFVLQLGKALRQPFYLGIFAAELIMLIVRAVNGTGFIRRKLKPFDDLAAMTEDFSRGFDENRLQELENAIGGLSPLLEDEQLHISDPELAGLENAVNRLVLRMRETYRQQGRFVSDASHELRTPIAVIKGYADMLDRWGKEDPQILEESIAAIKAESENMNRLVEQLLFLARGDSGRQKMNFESISLSDIMRESYGESVMIDPEHEYRISAEENVTARGDAAMIKQTARILLDNAKKYTPAGGEIRIGVGTENGAPYFSIADSGIGIPSDDLAHVFERFYRVDGSRSKQTGGSGLGLSIARWIIERHGGRIDILSREEFGTKITVTLKAAE